jgi:Trypsin-like peptidase domain
LIYSDGTPDFSEGRFGMKSRTRPIFACIAALATGLGPLTATELGSSGVLQPVNLVGSKNSNGQWIDPRGLLTVKGPELGLSGREIAQLRQTVGDVVCPGVQGTAFLVGQGRQILTNAHIFVDEDGRDRANLDKCFWQNKDEPFQRVPLEIGENTLKLFTRSTVREFYLDLAVARLERAIPEAHPLKFDARASVGVGEQLMMVSAGQLRMPSLPKQVTEFIRADPRKTAFEFDYNREPILQSCTVMAVGRPTDTVSNDAIYSDCSATKGASGSPVLVRSQTGELTIKGVHVGGGQDVADYTDFTLDDASPKGRSYSNALQLNRDLLDEITRFETEEQITQTR